MTPADDIPDDDVLTFVHRFLGDDVDDAVFALVCDAIAQYRPGDPRLAA